MSTQKKSNNAQSASKTQVESSSKLPNYVASATPNPLDARVGWLTTTAATYAGIMLWFVFWQDVPSAGAGFVGGILAQGFPFAVLSVLLAAAICFGLFYYVPAMLGMKTGLPLYIVGTSTYGVRGGFFMPGFLMGVLQFGWLAVNAYFSGLLIAGAFGQESNGPLHLTIGCLWAIGAAFVGLKGIRYVGMFASYMPILPLFVLGFLLMKTLPHFSQFTPEVVADLASDKAAGSVSLFGCQHFGILALTSAYVVGFFATAGAAGCDFGSSNKDSAAVWWGGFVGVFCATALTGICALLIICGTYGMPEVRETLKGLSNGAALNPVAILEQIVGAQWKGILMFMLVIAAFPSACFSSLIAANSFKTTLPKVDPMISCGLGVFVSCILVVTLLAGKAAAVFTVIGASFGPVCGSMVADYLLSGCKWAGPRAGFNPAGWLAWVFGFAVGSVTLLCKMAGCALPFAIPCPPVSAFVVGFVLYMLFASLGMQSKTLDMPQRIDQ